MAELDRDRARFELPALEPELRDCDASKVTRPQGLGSTLYYSLYRRCSSERFTKDALLPLVNNPAMA
ncbi:MAG TPA: hypothetical protein VG777_01915, partial [Thermoanaerobaculia bacterium]|nr:hypothetical protein [Thermoanaerobaculia bacterium]